MGVQQTTADATGTFQRIPALQSDIETHRLPAMGNRAPSALRLLRLLYRQPLINAQQAAETLEVPPATANRLTELFVKADILQEQTGFRRHRLFAFGARIKLFEGGVKA